jgi:hypothetical protein
MKKKGEMTSTSHKVGQAKNYYSLSAFQLTNSQEVIVHNIMISIVITTIHWVITTSQKQA